MQEQVHVRVDEAGQQSGIPEIDRLRALRVVDLFADGLDALALNQNLARRDNLARCHIKQPRGVKDNGRCRLLGSHYVWRSENSATCQQSNRQKL
jgi:hypothetical protein